MRHGLCRDLGFTDADRIENIRRAAHTARLMTDAGLIVLTAFISPFKADRLMARELFGPGEFVEVLSTPRLIYVSNGIPRGYIERRAKG